MWRVRAWSRASRDFCCAVAAPETVGSAVPRRRRGYRSVMPGLYQTKGRIRGTPGSGCRGSLREIIVAVDGAAADDGGHHQALHRPLIERGGLCLAPQIVA